MSHLPVVNFKLRSNEDFYAEVSLVDANGDPLVISDFNEWIMHVRPSIPSRSVTLVLSTGNGRLSIPTEGTFAVALDKEALWGIPAGTYAHDLRGRQEGGYADLWKGSFIIEQGVTRP